MVTYDSYHRVEDVLLKNNVTNYKIIVDEYQEILNAYIYRRRAISTLLKSLQERKNVTYMSATPIAYGFRPKELEELPEYEILWSEVQKIKMYTSNKIHRPLGIIKNAILVHKSQGIIMEEKPVEELHIFINSVTTASQIIKACNLTKENTRVVCAQHTNNTNKLKGFPISDISKPNKTYNFYTKTAFYGADIYSNNGLIIIVSTGYLQHTQLDIKTDIK